MNRLFRVFLCHASQDKPVVYELYNALKSEGWIDPWLDQAKILPGQDWRIVIEEAVEESDVVIVCLSNQSLNKEGFVQKEIRYAYDIALEKPTGTIFLIPLRLEDCILPRGLRDRHWVDYFGPEKSNSYARLIEAFKLRYKQRLNQEENLKQDKSTVSIDTNLVTIETVKPAEPFQGELDLYRFILIDTQANSKINYQFGIGKYPVTNAQYERFLTSPDFANPVYWLEYPKFNEACERIGDWGKKGLDWLQDELKKTRSTIVFPRYWDHKDFGKSNQNNPVIGISWYEAGAYCEWLLQNWNSLSECQANPSLDPKTIRLPLESEWITAAGGHDPVLRYPWDEKGQTTTSLKEILRRTNISESRIGHTVPVNTYTLGKSSYGVMDMAGNAWEWQINYYDRNQDVLSLRGGSWLDDQNQARAIFRYGLNPSGNWRLNFGFRAVVISNTNSS